MLKPRIIIADTNYDYIIPLQLKFIEEFYEKIELEIITDKDFFQKLFLSPQSIDILITSEDIYTSNIKKHNIKHIFVMKEQLEKENTEDLMVHKLFKYTSIKKVFNEIVGLSADVLNVEKEEKKSQIILLNSASGGVGKTTLAMGLCGYLSKNYKKVLYVNAENLQTFQFVLNNKTPITSYEIYEDLKKNNIYQNIKHVIRKELFSYLPPFKTSLMSLGLNLNIFYQIAKSAKETGDYDFIVVDSDSSFDENKAQLMELADKVIIITDQTKKSVFSTNILATNINGLNFEKYLFICNNFDKNEDNALLSPNTNICYTINEYIEKMDKSELLSCEALSSNIGIQKLAYLLI